MADETAISWCDHTWSPWVGCTKVSPACDNCYAESWAKRAGNPELWTGERRRTTASYWQRPIRWDREAASAGVRQSVFPSLCDPFDNQVPSRWRDDFWHRVEQTPHLDWLLLTKRPQNVAKMLPDPRTGTKPWGEGWPNVWLGTTAENQEEADRRIPHLLAAPARVHFLSCEPLLGPVDLTRISLGSSPATFVDMPEVTTAEFFVDALKGAKSIGWPRIDWVIAGGESGGPARPMHPEWARSLRDQCAAAGVPFHFKQWGQWHPDALLYTDARTGERPPPKMKVGVKAAGRLLDGVEHNGMPA